MRRTLAGAAIHVTLRRSSIHMSTPDVVSRLRFFICVALPLALSFAATAASPPPALSGSQRDWDARFRAAYARQSDSDAVDALTVIAQRWPQLLSHYADRSVLRVINALAQSPPEQERRLQLLRALYAARWKFDYGVEPSNLWGDLVRMLVDRGEFQEARHVVGRIRAPRAILELRVDKRFDVLRKNNPKAFDVRLAAEQELADWAGAAARFPRELDATAELIYAHLNSGKFEEALSLADATLARIQAGSARALYDDPENALNWIYDYRGRALRALGEWRECELNLKSALAEPEWGRRNVSNAINLASFYVEFNRIDEAVDALGTLPDPHSPVSGYGRMQVMVVSQAIALARKDAVGARTALDYMREHWSDAPETYRDALLRADEIEDAAAFLIERLLDLQTRASALASVQSYPEAPRSPQGEVIAARWARLLTREDVRSAIAQVGRVERSSIPR
jgi:beta-barrel assembly-enhancing protease